jgi:hypothetical protein
MPMDSPMHVCSAIVKICPGEASCTAVAAPMAGPIGAHTSISAAAAAQAAYVRQRVLQTWTKLVEDGCVPINHWNILLAQGKTASPVTGWERTAAAG